MGRVHVGCFGGTVKREIDVRWRRRRVRACVCVLRVIYLIRSSRIERATERKLYYFSRYFFVLDTFHFHLVNFKSQVSLCVCVTCEVSQFDSRMYNTQTRARARLEDISQVAAIFLLLCRGRELLACCSYDTLLSTIYTPSLLWSVFFSCDPSCTV